ncbi:hypothetical protein ILUMI_26617, partial [Ignelater luminosus]
KMSLFQCTEEEKQKILGFHRKTQKQIDEDAENLQNWMKKQAHFPEILDKDIIGRFLALHKFRIQETKEILDNYYTIRSLLPEFYEKNVNDPDIKKIMDIAYHIPLPKLTKDLHRVIVSKFTGKDMDDFDSVAYMIYAVNVGEVRLREDYFLYHVFIFDFEGVKADLLLKFTPTFMKRAALISEKVFTTRPHGIHFINAPSYVNSFLNLLKTILKPKLASRMHVHSDMESLREALGKNVLPIDYGGEEKSLAELNDLWKQKLLEYEDVFESNRKVRVDENLRIGKSLNTEFYGIEGNFKKLEID